MEGKDADAVAAAVRQVVAFSLGREEYAVPIGEVREVVRTPDITPVPGGQAFIVGVMNLRGKIVPVLDLERLFGLDRDTGVTALAYVMVTEDAKGGLFGVRVDEVSEVLKITDEAVKPAPAMVHQRISADYVEGVIIQPGKTEGDPERMLLFLNLQKIVTEKAPEKEAQTSPEGASAGQP